MKTSRAPLLAITLLAFALRIYHLAGQSLWYDEGFSVWLAQKSLSEITARTAADIQPPVYYYLLHLWMLAAGHSEFAVRFLSVAFGALTIPLLYLLARRLLNPAVASLAALVLAVAPFHVWYAQEARMYALVTMLGVLSGWLLIVLLTERDVSARLVLYAAANIVAVYAHYYAFFLVAFQALFVLIWWLWRRSERRAALRVLAAQAITALAYLPWAGFALNRYAVDESYWQGTLSLDFVRKTLLAFAAGPTVYESQAQVVAVGFVLLAIVGVAALLAAPRLRVSASFLLLYLVVPFALLYLLSAWRPKFNPRYLMIAAPPFALLVATGIAAIYGARWLVLRVVAVASMAFVLLTSGYALANNYTNRVYVRDDFRSLAARIAAARQPDEAIVLCSGHMFPVFEYYYPGAPEYRIPDLATLSTRAVVSYEVAGRLNQIAAAHGGIWLVLWQNDVVDPGGILTSLLDAQTERVPEASAYWGIELRHYRFPAGAVFSRPSISHPLSVRFGSRLALLGYNQNAVTVASGQAIPLTLFWQAGQALNEDYWLALRLVDQAGHVFGRLDQRPAIYTYPTSQWQPNTLIPGQASLPVLAGAPPGDYTLRAGIFVPGGAPLDVVDERGATLGADAILGTIRVDPAASPPSVESLGLARTLSLALGGGIDLVATSLTDGTVQQGQTLHIEAAWRNTRKVAKDYRLLLRLQTPDGRLIQEERLELAGNVYPTSAWPAGSVLRGQYDITIPAAAPAQVQVLVGLDGADAPQVMARLAVSPVTRTTTVPPMQHVQPAAFATLATLLGYDLTPTTVHPGEALDVTLYWQAGSGAQTRSSVTVFTHLLGSGVVYGQHDGVPAAEQRPTSGWLAGEIITDRHRLVVRPDAPPGDYMLEIGLYDPVSTLRIPLAAGGDHLILETHVRVVR